MEFTMQKTVADEALLAAGYKYYGRQDYKDKDGRCHLFQKTIHQDDGGRFFINVHRWDLSDLDPGHKVSYTIGAAYDTPLGWVQMEYYSLGEKELCDKLGEREAKVQSTFELLEGVWHD
jgi:hypothetical protein